MSHSVNEILKFISEYICDNQAGLAQYTFLASEGHKKLKNSVNQLEDGIPVNIDEIKTNFNELEEYLYLGFCEAFDNSFNYAIKFFQPRAKNSPRACIKVIAAEYLTTLYRKPELYIKDENVKLQDNTAFQCIAQGEKYFICNDIPEGIKNGSYRNSRIIQEAVLQYKSQANLSALEKKSYDKEWIKCWKKVILVNGIEEEIPSPPEACYKSTLVIPMSLLAKKLDQRFLSHFQIGKLPNIPQKAIFGFLCFDHHTENFFNEDIDVSFGYILADVLSLYLIQQLTYTQYSSAYFRAKHFLEL
ncbi:MAG TPA: hypothetical protein DCL61_15460 [Cyanobacteria bacterium UBA12227]|nr:hypothetical protein [Cyanobacteria bacterium UBA12227]HAX88369.1 hypothetical protein [Cyanobacteria bacterium UBA11370]HBY77854.1 hypothetical protein [Cyanobacteria bacterium UBA11148]